MASNMGVVVWEWSDEFGRWRPYEPVVSDFIEQNSAAGFLHLVHADPSLHCYVVDTQAMQQIRQGTGKVRPLRRNIYPLSSPAYTGVSWQWSGDQPNTWNAYDMDVACILEDEFCKSKRIVDLSQTQARLPYTLDFHAMTQTRNQSGFSRKLRRIKLNASYTQQTPLVTPGAVASNTNFGAMSNVHAVPLLRATRSAGVGQSTAPSVSQQAAQNTLGMKKKSDTSLHGSPPKVPRTRSQMRKTQSMPNPFQPSVQAATAPPVMHPSMSYHGGFTINGAIPNGFTFGAGGSGASNHSRPHALRLSSAMTGMTNTFISPAVPLMISPHMSGPGAGSTTITANNASDQSAEDVINKYVSEISKPPQEEDCCICCDSLSDVSGYGDTDGQGSVVWKLKCSHMFHKLCLCAMYNSGTKDGHIQCPTCKKIFGEKRGNCPPGRMEYKRIDQSLPGHENCGTISIIYIISPGIQGPEHPHPGQRFSARGFPRQCFLPDNEKGRKVLRLLIKAFERRLTFTIGNSATTGETGTVVWNEIHHKTELGSNHTGHGFPDPKYLDNVLMELASQGVTEDT